MSEIFTIPALYYGWRKSNQQLCPYPSVGALTTNLLCYVAPSTCLVFKSIDLKFYRRNWWKIDVNWKRWLYRGTIFSCDSKTRTWLFTTYKTTAQTTPTSNKRYPPISTFASAATSTFPQSNAGWAAKTGTSETTTASNPAIAISRCFTRFQFCCPTNFNRQTSKAININNRLNLASFASLCVSMQKQSAGTSLTVRLPSSFLLASPRNRKRANQATKATPTKRARSKSPHCSASEDGNFSNIELKNWK